MDFRLVFLFAFYASASCLGQQQPFVRSNDPSVQRSANTAVFVEALGGPTVYSINLQRIVASHSALAFSYRLGASYLPGYTSVTGYIGGIVGRSSRTVDFAVGAGYYGVENNDPSSVNFAETRRNNLYVTPQIGYRSVKEANGFLFRVTLTPWLFANEGLGRIRFTPGFGISVGKRL